MSGSGGKQWTHGHRGKHIHYQKPGNASTDSFTRKEEVEEEQLGWRPTSSHQYRCSLAKKLQKGKTEKWGLKDAKKKSTKDCGRGEGEGEKERGREEAREREKERNWHTFTQFGTKEIILKKAVLMQTLGWGWDEQPDPCGKEVKKR